jgi:hypothetical protein
VVCAELGIADLSEVFDWIDLEAPIGSASISQVHKAQLRRFSGDALRRLQRREAGQSTRLVVGPGDTAWGVCNSHGISLAELAAANRCACVWCGAVAVHVHCVAIRTPPHLAELGWRLARTLAATHPGAWIWTACSQEPC